MTGLAVIADGGKARAIAAIGRRRDDRLIDGIDIVAGGPHRKNQRGEDGNHDESDDNESSQLTEGLSICSRLLKSSVQTGNPAGMGGRGALRDAMAGSFRKSRLRVSSIQMES